MTERPDCAGPERPDGTRTGDTPSPVAAFLPSVSLVDFPGRMAAVFFTSGCNFRCGFCHNARSLGAFRPGMPWGKWRELLHGFRGQWADGAVITGGEPTLHDELPRLVAEIRSAGFAVKLDTNGSRPEALERVIGDVDYVAMDIKCAPDRYPDWAGFADLEALGRSVELIRTRARDSEFRLTVVESFHDDDQLRAIGKWIEGARRMIVQPFVPRDDLPDVALRSEPRTRPQRLDACRAILTPFAQDVLIRGG